MTVKQLSSRLRDMLAAKFDAGEARAIERIIIEHCLNMSPVDAVIKADMQIPDFTENKATGMAERVRNGEPVQYVVGHARFCGFDFKVTPAVLIPRPETAQLVDMITDRHSYEKDLRVLDCGTGSGCIAITLARVLKFPEVTAIDISADALEIARENASRIGADIIFRQKDILSLDLPGEWDVIVSNPPYVLESERTAMESHVLDHEPHQALFVPDTDPLRFYSAILAYASSHLAQRGSVYFEINPIEADRYSSLASSFGFRHTDIVTDMYGRKRFAIISRQ